MADPIRLIDAFRAFKNLPHQIAAAELLDDNLTAEQREQFQELFRADPPEKPQASPSPGVDWLTSCRAIVREFEGCRLEAYVCPAGVLTIGWGHTGPDVTEGLVWTQQQADAALDAELSNFRAAAVKLLPMLPRWNAQQQAAIVSFTYNVGTGALEESTLRKRLLAGEDPALVVREELPRWNKGGGGVLEGLVRRRAAEVALFCGEQPATATPQPGRVRPTDPFSTRLSAHFTLGELALNQEARRFHHQHQVDTAAELCAFLERVRTRFSKPVVITSGYRPPEINRAVGGASSSEHLFDAPGVGAVDFYVDGAPIQAVQDWCDTEWPYSVGYGAPKGFVHLGIRKGRPRVRWDY